MPHAAASRLWRRSPAIAHACALALGLSLAGCASTVTHWAPSASPAATTSTPAAVIDLPAQAQQGALVLGHVPPGSTVRWNRRPVRVAADGTVVFGIGRDASGAPLLEVVPPAGPARAVSIAIQPRDWPIERIDGVPPQTVDPPPAIAERIRAEQARVMQARTRDDDRLDFLQPFLWPVEGRISGRFGNQRIYNGSAGAPHSGMDIAAAEGTPVRAPAAGVVSFADPDLYLTGGTVVLDHGFGVSSNFLHLSRLDVREGDYVAQGQTLGAVGSTGRATGPHLHWGMNWFDVRVDPLLVLERTPSGATD